MKLGGHTEQYVDEHGRLRVRWVPDKVVNGVPYDTPILGYGNNTANMLRLWKAEAPESFDFSTFNRGDYYGAVEQKVASENLSKVLYPNDEQIQGKELRLEQQYFFVVVLAAGHAAHPARCRRFRSRRFHEKFAVQLNDTHPAIAVAELMRLLVDEHGMRWDDAWEITRQTFAYTNHTLLPEALEHWPLALFGRMLPRHLEIVYEINARFLDEVRLAVSRRRGAHRAAVADRRARRALRAHGQPGLRRQPCDQRRRRAALRAAEAGRVARLPRAVAGEVQQQDQRHHATTLADAGESAAGAADHRMRSATGWTPTSTQLRGLERVVDDADFRSSWRDVKHSNKVAFARYVQQELGMTLDPHSMFDVQVKRIHEYKRQHLNILHVIALYLRLKDGRDTDLVPRTFIFGGKAAPGYRMAKLIIKLINAVGSMINRDPATRDRLRVVFVPNFSVRTGQRMYPCADLSRADVDRRQGSVRHRQHEVHYERRADHRHARRRQHRDPRGSRRRRISSCSA